jgi:hypothetical protein
MKDQILKGYVDDFKKGFELDEVDEATIFEHFVNYCIVSKQYPRDFNYDDLHVGGSDDIGLDGAAFIVNGNIVKAEEEIEYLRKNNGYLDVSFSFIQTKKSTSFKGDQVGTLIFGIKSFFDDVPSIPENEGINNLRLIKNEIYKNSISFQQSPTLKIFFATTGEWKEPEQITGRVTREIREIEEKRLFSKIEFIFYDAEKLKQAYREINRKTIKEVSFSNHVALPEIEGVRQAFVGSISAKEYISLISDEEGKLQRYLFEDNVRDYQGENKVNKEIRNTIRNSKEQAALSVFNNGITIIAKKVEPIGKKMKLTDFQIVNGCQSSHVLFENKSFLLEDTHIVIRVIETTDYEFATKVVKATNRQTEVKDEAFESLSQFHKDLEEYYKAKSKVVPEAIFYERRSKQYDGNPTIKTAQVVNLPAQISAYVAAHLSQPQSTHRYYGELLESNRSRMFKTGTKLEPYYISALILKRVELAFKRGMLDNGYKAFKYHIVFLVYQFYIKRMQLQNGYSYEQIIEELSALDKCTKVFVAGIQSIKQSLKSTTLSKHDAARSKAFTEKVYQDLESQIPEKHITKTSSNRQKRTVGTISEA